MRREHLTRIVRLLTALGILLLMLAFLRACFSPPRLPLPQPASDVMQSGSLPPRY